MITLTAEQARSIAVRAQLLDAPRPASLAEVAQGSAARGVRQGRMGGC